MQALIAGLEDIHLEVRFQCGRALDALRQRSGIEYDHEVLYDIIERELSKSPDLEHVFSLIGVVLPREPVRVAFEALGASDPQLRGLASSTWRAPFHRTSANGSFRSSTGRWRLSHHGRSI